MNFNNLLGSDAEKKPYKIFKQNIKFQKSTTCLEQHWTEQLFFVYDVFQAFVDQVMPTESKASLADGCQKKIKYTSNNGR